MSRVWLQVAGALLAPLVLLSACTNQIPGDSSPASVTLCLPGNNGWMPLTAEIAATPEARSRGLSGRERLPRRAGMLFVYPQNQGPGNQFWMYQTNIPLTIAFMKADGTIARLQGMSPCLNEDGDQCSRYEAGVTHRVALEVNQGLFEALGVKAGDRIALDPSPRGKCQERARFSLDTLPGAH